MGRDDVLDENVRYTCSISATSIVGGGGGIAHANPNFDELAKASAEVDQSGTPARAMHVLLFAISLLTIALAFSSGPTFIGMFFALVSIACFGYGFGSVMNSPAGAR